MGKRRLRFKGGNGNWPSKLVKHTAGVPEAKKYHSPKYHGLGGWVPFVGTGGGLAAWRHSPWTVVFPRWRRMERRSPTSLSSTTSSASPCQNVDAGKGKITHRRRELLDEARRLADHAVELALRREGAGGRGGEPPMSSPSDERRGGGKGEKALRATASPQDLPLPELRPARPGGPGPPLPRESRQL